MDKCNNKNPTVDWTEDEMYAFAKSENKWLKFLHKPGQKNGTKEHPIRSDHRDFENFYSNANDLTIALEHEIEEKVRKYKLRCHICDFGTPGLQSLTHHLGTHGIGRRFKCTLCERDFSRKPTLDLHTRTMHGQHELLACDQCGKTYKFKESLYAHKKNIHGPQTKCDHCSMTFGSRQSYGNVLSNGHNS